MEKISVVILISVFLLAGSWAFAEVVKSNPVEILCLGDSITRGSGAEGQGGYRGPLQRMLTQAGLQCDFVGRFKTQGIPDPDHEGDGGMRLVRMLRENEAVARQALDANPNPEIILLLIGINDLIENRNTPQATLDRMALLLDELKQYAPNAKIIVGNLVPNASDDPVRDPAGYDPAKTYVNSEDKVLLFNKLLPALIESKRTQGINVDCVDLHSVMTRYDLSDGIHPNKIGYDKMASVWFKAVMASAAEMGVVAAKAAAPNKSTHVVETFTGPVFDLPNWADSGADTDGFNGRGQFTIKSPYRGLRRTVGKGAFESLFEMKNIKFAHGDSVIHLGFVPFDPSAKVIAQIRPKGISLIFRDPDATPVINQKYDDQAVFERPPGSLKVKIAWDEPKKQWRIFYGVDNNEPQIEIPQSRKGLFFSNDIDVSNEALVFIERGSTDVDHFEFGTSVHGSAYYEQLPAEQFKRRQVKSGYSPGSYYDCEIPGSSDRSFVGAEFRLWIPEDLASIKGIIVRQHGTGANGKRFAHDLQFQALAKKHDFVLMATFMKATDDCRQWPQPEKGSGDAFIQALQILAQKTGRPEITEVPWILWGHSAGGHWANYMARKYPDRVTALISRSGHGSEYTGRDLAIPNLQIAGEKEADPSKDWYLKLLTGGELRAIAVEPGVGHACSSSRFLTVAFIEAVLDELKKNNQKPLERKNGWLGDINTFEIAPYQSFSGDKANAYWMVNENFAHKWKSFVTTGKVLDKTPPTPPFDVTIERKGDTTLLKWKAAADVETGLKQFNIYRNGKIIGIVPGQKWNRGDEPDPIDCPMQYTIDIAEFAKDEKTSLCTYAVSNANYSGSESMASALQADF
jgi:lysophospholipase L1-like esterase/pimeloyl-ACP methyl ester carboxylesterase